MFWRAQNFTALPAGIEPWLRDTGSLTRRVIQACNGGAFRVRLLRQGWGKPWVSEAGALRVRLTEATLIREVDLECNGRPWVFARTLIPATSFSGPARRLAYLGEKPLGAVLFSERQVSRGTTQLARIQPQHLLYQAATDHLDEPPPEVWGRRTLFYFAHRPILVNEIFLPDIPEFPG